MTGGRGTVKTVAEPAVHDQPELEPHPDVEKQWARRRRRTLLLRSGPVVLAAVLLAVKLMSLPISAGQAAGAYDVNDAGGTLGGARAMGLPNLVERWKPRFAEGDGHVLQGDFEKARDQFELALGLVPEGESCKVRVNLVLSLEKLGEGRQKAGDPASAKEFFAEGSKVVAQAPRDCFMENSKNNQDGEGQKLREADERLSKKQSGGQGDEVNAPQSGGQTPADPPPAGKLEQLEKTGQKAQQERGQRQKIKEQMEQMKEGDPEPYAKPW